MKVNIADAKAHLSRYVQDLLEGREDVIVVCHRNVPVAELRALPQQRKAPRPLGLARGQVTIKPEFFDPLPEDLLAAFEGKDE